jgi:hypothetical protein
MSSISIQQPGERLTFEAATKRVEPTLARVASIKSEITRRATLQGEWERKLRELQLEAKEDYGTDDPVQIAKSLDERLLANGAAVPAFEQQVAAKEAELAASAHLFQVDSRSSNPGPR